MGRGGSTQSPACRCLSGLSDCFSHGFVGLYESGRVVEEAYWAHVRRKFFDLHTTGTSPVSSEALTHEREDRAGSR